MADPISVTMAVVGLLQASAQISAVLNTFIGAIRNAPKQAQIALIEINETRTILHHLQGFLLRSDTIARSRTTLVQIDEIVVVLSGCVTTFSELEAILDELLVEEWTSGTISDGAGTNPRSQALLKESNDTKARYRCCSSCSRGLSLDNIIH